MAGVRVYLILYVSGQQAAIGIRSYWGFMGETKIYFDTSNRIYGTSNRIHPIMYRSTDHSFAHLLHLTEQDRLVLRLLRNRTRHLFNLPLPATSPGSPALSPLGIQWASESGLSA